MFARIASTIVLLTGAFLLAGCGTTIYNLRVLLVENPAGEVTNADARVVIEDLRPDNERKAHRGKEIRSCERWFGDDTLVPSKLEFLARRVSERTRSDMKILIRLKRFDVVEYCESTPVGGGTGAARTNFTPAPDIGDTVAMHLAGDVNGTPFDLNDRFDYDRLYRFPNLPSSSPQYREQLRTRLDQLVKEISNIVWSAEIARINGNATR